MVETGTKPLTIQTTGISIQLQRAGMPPARIRSATATVAKAVMAATFAIHDKPNAQEFPPSRATLADLAPAVGRILGLNPPFTSRSSSAIITKHHVDFHRLSPAALPSAVQNAPPTPAQNRLGFLPNALLVKFAAD